MSHQEGSLRKVGKPPYEKWELRFKEKVFENGVVTKKQRARRLGYVRDIGSLTKAKKIRDPIMAEVNARNGAEKIEVTVRWASEQWLKTEVLRLAPSSQASIKSCIGKIVEEWGNHKLEDVRPRAAQDWMYELPDELGIKPVTARNYLGTFNMLFKFARFSEYINYNPLEGVRPPKQKGEQEKPTFTLDQMREILFRATVEPFATMFHILAETGMRGGELCGLFTSDIDLDARIIRIRRGSYQGHLQADPKTKNARRTVHISGRLTERIRQYTESVFGGPRASSFHEVKGADAKNTCPPLLFPTETLLAWDNSDIVAYGLDPILNAMNIKTFRTGLHAFRHSNRTLMHHLGISEKYACLRSGHATGNKTADNGQATITPMGMNYIHGEDERHREIAELIADALSPVKKPVSSESVQPLALGMGAD